MESTNLTSFMLLHGAHKLLVSRPARNNLRKIRLVTLRTFLGLLHTSAGFERSWHWPYMDVLTSTWLQLSPISIPTSARAPVGHPSNWTCCNLIGYMYVWKAPESSPMLPDGHSVGTFISGWSQDYLTHTLLTTYMHSSNLPEVLSIRKTHAHLQ